MVIRRRDWTRVLVLFFFTFSQRRWDTYQNPSRLVHAENERGKQEWERPGGSFTTDPPCGHPPPVPGAVATCDAGHIFHTAHAVRSSSGRDKQWGGGWSRRLKRREQWGIHLSINSMNLHWKPPPENLFFHMQTPINLINICRVQNANTRDQD